MSNGLLAILLKKIIGSIIEKRMKVRLSLFYGNVNFFVWDTLKITANKVSCYSKKLALLRDWVSEYLLSIFI